MTYKVTDATIAQFCKELNISTPFLIWKSKGIYRNCVFRNLKGNGRRRNWGEVAEKITDNHTFHQNHLIMVNSYISLQRMLKMDIWNCRMLNIFRTKITQTYTKDVMLKKVIFY